MILAGGHASPEQPGPVPHRGRGGGGRLQHPNIVQIYEIGEAARASRIFSLEFVDGGSLAEQLDGTPLPARPAARLVETLARAMHVRPRARHHSPRT